MYDETYQTEQAQARPRAYTAAHLEVESEPS